MRIKKNWAEEFFNQNRKFYEKYDASVKYCKLIVEI